MLFQCEIEARYFPLVRDIVFNRGKMVITMIIKYYKTQKAESCLAVQFHYLWFLVHVEQVCHTAEDTPPENFVFCHIDLQMIRRYVCNCAVVTWILVIYDRFWNTDPLQIVLRGENSDPFRDRP